MTSTDNTLDLTRFIAGSLPTPDAMMVALLEQQKLIEQQQEDVQQKSALIQNQQAQINLLEEQLRLLRHQRYGKSSEKKLLQQDWLADEAEMLADGEPDADDGEIEPDADTDETEDDQKKRKKKKRNRRGFSPDLPRV